MDKIFGSHSRPAAIVSADVAGYSRLMGHDENPTFARPTRSFSQMQRWFTEHAAGATELIDDVDDADKRSHNDKYLDRR